MKCPAIGCCLAAWVFAVAAFGCGDSKKAEVPTNLNQPLPPPPVAGGGKGKVDKDAPPAPMKRAE